MWRVPEGKRSTKSTTRFYETYSAKRFENWELVRTRCWNVCWNEEGREKLCVNARGTREVEQPRGNWRSRPRLSPFGYAKKKKKKKKEKKLLEAKQWTFDPPTTKSRCENRIRRISLVFSLYNSLSQRRRKRGRRIVGSIILVLFLFCNCWKRCSNRSFVSYKFSFERDRVSSRTEDILYFLFFFLKRSLVLKLVARADLFIFIPWFDSLQRPSPWYAVLRKKFQASVYISAMDRK